MQYEAPWMNDELRILKDAAKKFFEQEFVPEAARWNAEGVVDKAAWRKAGEAGLLCAEMPWLSSETCGKSQRSGRSTKRPSSDHVHPWNGHFNC